MIVDLPGTTTNDVNRRLVALREEQGVSTMGRVLTLVVSVTAESVLEESIAAANDASREHPCRVILVSPADASAGDPRLDAQIRVGRDGGAGEPRDGVEHEEQHGEHQDLDDGGQGVRHLEGERPLPALLVGRRR